MGVWSGFYGGRQQAGGLTAIGSRHFSEHRAALPKGSKSGPIFSAKKVFLRAWGFQRGMGGFSHEEPPAREGPQRASRPSRDRLRASVSTPDQPLTADQSDGDAPAGRQTPAGAPSNAAPSLVQRDKGTKAKGQRLPCPATPICSPARTGDAGQSHHPRRWLRHGYHSACQFQIIITC
jgi:hypothetical protein